jgi:DNA ligase (NAD+)
MINQIINALDKADNAYYNSGKALMSDADYDKLKDKLSKLSPGHPRLSKVGAKVEAHRSEVKLLMHMGSQNKASNDTEFFKWYDVNNGAVLISDKQDGSSMEILYLNGKLTRVATRGDGTTGLDITQNALLWSNLPKTVNVSGQLIVRAEAYMKISVWKANFPGTDNPRNIANGIVSRKTDSEKDNRHIVIAAFDIVHPDIEFSVQTEKLVKLQSLGFDVVRYHRCETVDEIKDIRKQYIDGRSSLDYEIDGMVVAYDNLATQEQLGYSDGGTRPNGQVAWKFETAKGKTTVKGMTITMGSTGAIIPTAILEPIFVGGITISNVLLNNFDYINDLNVNVGDEVEIERAGDVIPHMNKVIKKNSVGPYPRPTHCYVCGEALKIDGRFTLCVNDSCPGKKVELIRNWIKKTNIKYIGDEVLMALVEGQNAIVNKISDLYKLTVDQIKDINIGNGVLGKSNATKIVMEIEKTKVMDLDLFMGSLGIKFLGRSMAKHIGYATAAEYISATVDDLATKDNMGPNKARDMKASILTFKDIIVELQTYVKINDQVKKSVNTSGKHAGVTMCFTGIRPTDAERDQMEKVGIVEKSSVSKGLTYLVQKSKDSTSGKTEKALSYGTKILGYNEFQEMIKD